VRFERLAGVLGVVGAEVVDDDDGVRRQLGDHLLGHVQTEDVPVHGSVECARRHDPRQAERHHQRDGRSGVERDRRVGALGRRGARVAPRHVHAEAELVDVEQARRLDLLDLLPEGLTLLLDFGPILFRSVLRFFSG